LLVFCWHVGAVLHQISYALAATIVTPESLDSDNANDRI
jgi:hypothetical protein